MNSSDPRHDEKIAEQVIKKKFDFHTNFGEVVVPEGYAQHQALRKFYKEQSRKFSIFNSHITDMDFMNSSYRFTEGERFQVSGYVQNVPFTTSEQRYKFSKLKKSELVGVYGLALLWEQHEDLFTDDLYHAALDQKEYLLVSGNDLLVPSILVKIKPDTLKRSSKFVLNSVTNLWMPEHMLLIFNKD